jgi:hypothetical protein
MILVGAFFLFEGYFDPYGNIKMVGNVPTFLLMKFHTVERTLPSSSLDSLSYSASGFDNKPSVVLKELPSQ